MCGRVEVWCGREWEWWQDDGFLAIARLLRMMALLFMEGACMMLLRCDTPEK